MFTCAAGRAYRLFKIEFLPHREALGANNSEIQKAALFPLLVLRQAFYSFQLALAKEPSGRANDRN